MKFSIVMTTYNRSDFLYYTLRSLQRQGLASMDHELLVVNDGDRDETEKVCYKSDVARNLNIRHIHSGVRTQQYWRCMGFTANIGIRQAVGDIVVLTNSDIFHVGQTIRPVIQAAERDGMAMSTLNDVFDDDGRLIHYLRKRPKANNAQLQPAVDTIRYGKRPPGFYPANPDVPFFLAVRREHLMAVGGYDEDFIGCASEDCDLLDRLCAIGCHYVYAPEGSEAIHLFHGRRTIAQLEDDPGFAHNIRLRHDRASQVVRNVGRQWGELIDPDAPWDSAPMHLVLWVTSRCNLACPHCNQQATRECHPEYDMPSGELDRFIASCQQRAIHFSTIELTGGEPTLWPLFEEGIRRLQESGITDNVTFVTNGNAPESTAATANRYGIRYVVSKSQATPEQAESHRRLGVGVVWNDLSHRALPTAVNQSVLPGNCSQRRDGHGRVVRQLMYTFGEVWSCCMAYANSRRTGEDSVEYLHCAFDDDFDQYFRKRATDIPICGVCLCNNRLWLQLEEAKR